MQLCKPRALAAVEARVPRHCWPCEHVAAHCHVLHLLMSRQHILAHSRQHPPANQGDALSTGLVSSSSLPELHRQSRFLKPPALTAAHRRVRDAACCARTRGCWVRSTPATARTSCVPVRMPDFYFASQQKMADDQKEPVVINGGCLCGAVRYNVTQSPAYQLICLCTQCQALGGGFGVGSIVVPNESVEVAGTGVEHLQDFKVAGSTNPNSITRFFCLTCGTHVMAKSNHPLVAVHAGTLDDPSLFQPQVAIWCQSKRDYHCLPESVAQFDQYPPAPPPQ